MGQALDAGPGVVGARLQLHSHLQGEAGGPLVLLLTHPCRGEGGGGGTDTMKLNTLKHTLEIKQHSIRSIGRFKFCRTFTN